MHTNRPERLRAFNYVGFHRYFLTFCTFQRCRWFDDADNVALARTEILRAADTEQFAILAYCFMPDHFHALVEAQTEDADARLLIARTKQLSGYRFSRERRARLWQRYGYERVLRDIDGTLAVARYILENPVRAGIVAAPRDYPHSGCPTLSIDAVLEAVAWRPVRGPAEAGGYE